MSRSFGPAGRLGLLLACLATAVGCSGPAAAPPVPPSTPVPTTAATTTPTTPAAPPCSTRWGSESKTVPELGRSPVVAVRTGTDRCADRVEFELAGPAAGYSVRYVEQVVQDGSGAELPVPGGARLQVQLHHPAYDDAGQATLPGRAGEPIAPVTADSALQSVVFGGSFEGYSTFGVGVRGRLPFRVSVVDGPGTRSRIVLEVAHSWS